MNRIARRAHEIYELRGGEYGKAVEDWLQAEREIDAAWKSHGPRTGLWKDIPPADVREEIMPNTVQFTLVLRTTPERLYRAFLDPDAMVKWLPPNGFTGKVHHMDARVGGTYKMSFTNFTSGKSHSFGGEYLELVPHKHLRWTDRFDDPNLPGEMTVTVDLQEVSVGTEVNVVQEGIPDVIPPDACRLGWQESLTLLANLVEAEIPD
jgi:uncharacterized protein YndB with AHSA1/START domain